MPTPIRRRAVTATALVLLFILFGAACSDLDGDSLSERFGCNTEVTILDPTTITEFAQTTKPQGEDLAAWRRLIIERSEVFGQGKVGKGEVLILPRACELDDHLPPTTTAGS